MREGILKWRRGHSLMHLVMTHSHELRQAKKPKQLRDDGDRDRAIGKVTELREVRSSTLR